MTRIRGSSTKLIVAFWAAFMVPLGLTSTTPGALRPDAQAKISAESEGWIVSLTSRTACRTGPADQCFSLSIEDRSSGKRFNLRIANFTTQIMAIRFPTSSEAVIVGLAAPNLYVLTVVNLRMVSVRDTFLGYWAAISPTSRYVAYVKWYPPHIGYEYSVTNEYMIYDFTQSPAENRTPLNRNVTLGPYEAGWPVYPESVKAGDNVLSGQDVPVHTLASDGIFWIDNNTLAFVDRWRDTNTLIVAQLSKGLRAPLVATKPLPTSQLVNLESCGRTAAQSDLRAWSSAPGTLVFVNRIESIPDRPGWLRLRLAPQPCLTKTALDITPEANASRATAH